MPEYLKYRCCMCPQTNQPLKTCPPAPVLHHQETDCRFVKTYKDDRGWRYFVRSGIGQNAYKTFYLKPGRNGSHGYAKLPWRKSFDEAQTELNALAEKKKWAEVQ